MTLCINPRCPNPQNSDNAQFCQNCDSELLLKHRYRAMKALGGGGFGKTYEASDQGKLNKVIKVLINNSPKAIELFQREAEVLSQLNNPGIPKVEPNSYIVFHPANSQEAVHCLVMEKVEGMNLRDYLKKIGRPIDSDTAKQWLKELVLILQVVHDCGILHRDIKPQNIIFKPDGRLALIDFGAVREGTGTEFATAAGSGGGTEVASHMAGVTSVISRGYTAPEQVNGQAVKQSDFYSLGRTFVFLLTGMEPSEIPYDAHDDVLQWRKYASNAEPMLADLLDQMQSVSVRMRPQTAQEILQRLNFEQTSSQSTVRGRGEDIEVQLDISSDEAARGISKVIRYTRFIYTNGQRQQETKELTITIPQGVRDGQKLRLKRVGHGNEDGKAKDVFVMLNVRDVQKNTTSKRVNEEVKISPNKTIETESTGKTKSTESKGRSCFIALVNLVGLIALIIFLGGIILSFMNRQARNDSPTVPPVPTVPPEFPKSSCGEGGTSSWVLLKPKVGTLDELLADVRQRFCSDAYSFTYEGNQWVRAAAFGNKEGAENFAAFLGQHIRDVDIIYTWPLPSTTTQTPDLVNPKEEAWEDYRRSCGDNDNPEAFWQAWRPTFEEEWNRTGKRPSGCG